MGGVKVASVINVLAVRLYIVKGVIALLETVCFFGDCNTSKQ